jgi:hypothetical protein
LRIFGAYSRRVREGMTRLETRATNDLLLATAFEGPAGARTIVLLNRSLTPQNTIIVWPGKAFRYMETATPEEENALRPAPPARPDGSVEVTIEPGTLVTLSNVELGRLVMSPGRD